ncbi:MAG: DUF1552 domain-containing protein [Gammaproteobacteria bacterium]|nr:DUF1552 domain-containing protein [Gammaproteobacteria bacterium]
MFITKKHLSRRKVLKGAGASIALPMMDAMIPAATAQPAAKLRLGFVYIPHGAVYQNWTPATTGSDFEMSQILATLADYKSHTTVISDLRNKPAESPDPHAITAGTWLRCVAPEGTNYAEDGVSADQFAARELGTETPFPSLELSTNGGNGGSFSSTIAFRTPTQPLPMESNPRTLYFRMFGQGETNAEREAIAGETTSLLDLVMEDAASLNNELGASDKVLMGEYLESVREIELQMQKLAEQDLSNVNIPDAPVGVPGSFPAHLDLMYDLMALAYQADLTRVATFMTDREVSMRTYNHIGISDAFHPLSHHQDDPAKLERLSRVQSWYASSFARFVGKLADMPDVDGSILDNSMILYGSCMANSNLHNNDKVPSVILGKAAGRVKGGQHLKYPQDTPLANLMHTMLDKAGVPLDRFGDSTGLLSEI